MERAETSVARPVTPPELAQDLSNLDVVLGIHIDNFELAEATARALEAQSRAYNNVLDAGQAEHELSNFRLKMLEEERRARLWQNIGHWGLIGILGIAAATD